MNDFEKKLEKYGDLIVNIGLNIQCGKPLLITSSIENADLVRLITKKAYEKGANHVYVEWIDDELTLLKYKYESIDDLSQIPNWFVRKYESIAEEAGAVIRISSVDPYLLKDVDPEKLSAYRKANSIAMKNYGEYTMGDKITWCVVGAPSKAWAKRVFTECSEEEAVLRLWEYIFKTCRIGDEDPVTLWKEHDNNLKAKCKYLNEIQFKTLHYKSKETNLTIELVKDHIWEGGGGKTTSGISFFPNIPTEEIFTMPNRNGVNGKVKSTLPLNFNGNLIENFEFVFKDGKIVEAKAEKGQDLLDIAINIDDGARFLGEVALVPYDSPISNLKMLFYNTLFDENASCHLAFGACYPGTIKGGNNLSKEELLKVGGNDSLTHVDFMVGSEDLDIVGETWDKEKIKVFEKGNWAF